MIHPIVGHLPCLKDLIAVLFECFLIILLGYLSSRFKLISPQAKDLNSYLTTFALPTIIFLNIVRMEIQTINLSFLLCMLTAKLLVFIIVTILTLIISYPTNFGYAGALSILATQSNDFALGYPLMKSLYGESRSEMLNYLSLMAPIQLLILNPLGIVMLEYEKSRSGSSSSSEQITEIDIISSNNLDGADCDCKSNNQISSISCRMLDLESNTDINQKIEKTREAESNSKLRRRTSVSEDTTLNSLHAANKLQRDKINKNIKKLRLVIPSNGDGLASSATSCNLNIILDSDRSLGSQQCNADNEQATNCCYCDRPVNFQQQQQQQQQQQLESSSAGGSGSGAHAIAIRRRSSVHSVGAAAAAAVKQQLNLNFLYALVTNPLIIASVVALGVNQTYGPELPKLVSKVSNTIAASFAAPSLFVVGASMTGKFQLLIDNPRNLMLPAVLVLTKVVLLPSLMRTLASIVLPKYTAPEEIPFLIDFSFLYGLLPTAPTACIIAGQYGVLTNVVAISMLLSTFMSAPLTLAASAIINPETIIKMDKIERLISQTIKFSSSITLLLASIVLYAFWRSKKRINYKKFINLPIEQLVGHCKVKTNPTHIFLFILAASQILIGLAGACHFFLDTSGNDFKVRANYPVAAPISPNPSIQDPTLLISSRDDSALLERGVNVNNNSMPNHQIQAEPDNVDSGGQPSDDNGDDDMIQYDSNESDKFARSNQRHDNSNNNNNNNNYRNHHEVVMITQQSTSNYSHNDSKQSLSWPFIWLFGVANYKTTLNCLQYILASFGIMIARFIILCILIVTATVRFKGYRMATRVSSVLVKSFITIGLMLIICIIFDSQQTSDNTANATNTDGDGANDDDHPVVASYNENHHQSEASHYPSESTIPNNYKSLYFRLAYDTLFMLISIPVFALIIRSDNRSKSLLKGFKSHENNNLDNRRQLNELANSIDEIRDQEDNFHNDDDDAADNVDDDDAMDLENHPRDLRTQARKLRSQSFINHQNHHHHDHHQNEPSLTGIKSRHFVTSNVSLSSDTSSALTTNTNIDSSPNQDFNNNNNNANNSGNMSPIILASNRHQRQNGDSISVDLSASASNGAVISIEPTQISKNPAHNNNNSNNILGNNEQILPIQTSYSSSDGGGSNSYDNMDDNQRIQAAVQPHTIRSSERLRVKPLQVASGEVTSETNGNSNGRGRSRRRHRKSNNLVGLLQMSEFNKYSVLILFTLITTTLNLTNIIQKLAQEKPFGTFIQIEVMSVAMDFGQGLMTFLIYGFKGLSN